ncbi:MAG: SIS domain-containing protein [Chloroflexi bacterium]|jgi:D-sedoheptulose 7-phosphate isomerase|nr:SIS domain-containing protein [Chloroflexota bacterium]
MSKIIEDYLSGLQNCIEEISRQNIGEIADTVFAAYQKGHRIFIMGNGGSAATASHFACDLLKNTAAKGQPRMRATALTDNLSVITAIANDVDYNAVFEQQLIDQIDKGDVVIGITASGNSQNVLQAIKYAKNNGAIAVGLIGFGGGKLKDLADKSITLSCCDYGQVEDMHLVLEHIITSLVKSKIHAL